MPNTTSGFSGNEIVTFCQNWIGNQSTDFQTFLQQTLPLAEMRFCKAHNWNFLSKNNLSLTVASGMADYLLNTATLTDANSVGYYMASSDVRQIFSKVNGIPLRKMQMDELRRLDPTESQGTTATFITAWAPNGDNGVTFYPPNFADTTMIVEGKITPGALLTLTNYPTIPFRYQESFLYYVLSLALMRENDDRFQEQKQEAMEMIKQDIQNDIGSADDVITPRIRSLNEQAFDGLGSNLNSLYLNWIFSSASI